jgi:hypothetical protein
MRPGAGESTATLRTLVPSGSRLRCVVGIWDSGVTSASVPSRRLRCLLPRLLCGDSTRQVSKPNLISVSNQRHIHGVCFVLRATVHAAPRLSRREEGEQIVDADAGAARLSPPGSGRPVARTARATSAACSSSWTSISPKFVDWLPLADCGGYIRLMR